MSDKQAKNILKLFIFLGFLFLAAIATGTSYALLEDTEESKDNQVIKAGSIAVELTEYFDNISNNISVMTDEEGSISDKVYEFNIKNTGTVDAKYDLLLVNSIPSDYKGSILGSKYIKVSLDVNGVNTGIYNLGEMNNKLISDDLIKSKELLSCKLRIWYDYKYQSEIDTNINKKAFLKLQVDAKQNIEDSNSN